MKLTDDWESNPAEAEKWAEAHQTSLLYESVVIGSFLEGFVDGFGPTVMRFNDPEYPDSRVDIELRALYMILTDYAENLLDLIPGVKDVTNFEEFNAIVNRQSFVNYFMRFIGLFGRQGELLWNMRKKDFRATTVIAQAQFRFEEKNGEDEHGGGCGGNCGCGSGCG